MGGNTQVVDAFNDFLGNTHACLTDAISAIEVVENTSIFLFGAPFWLLVLLALIPILLAFYVREINRYMNEAAEVQVTKANTFLPMHRPPTVDLNHSKSTEISKAVTHRIGSSNSKILTIALLYLVFLWALSILVNGPSTASEFAEYALPYFWLWSLLSMPIYFLIFDKHKPAWVIGGLLTILVLVLWLPQALVVPPIEFVEHSVVLLLVTVFTLAYYCALCTRMFRRLVPYFTIVFTIAPLCTILLLFLVTSLGCMTWNIATHPSFAYFQTILAVGATILFVSLGLKLFAKAYSKRVISEQQLSFSCWFVVTSFIAYFIVQSTGEDIGKPLRSTMLIFFVLLAALYTYFEFSRAQSLYESPLSLLYLRVFRSSQKSLNLFRSIARPWRTLGPVHMIAGPDLAKVAVEPDKIYLFLRGRLRSLFIKTPENMQQVFNKPLYEPDPDGRYRINEFFCFDQIWKSVAEKLITESDFVLIDLREFTLDNLGAAQEIAILAATSSLSKTLFVVEDAQKQKHVGELISALTGYQVGWEQIVCVDVDGSSNLTEQLLDLRSNNTLKEYRYNPEAKTLVLWNETSIQAADAGTQQQLAHQHWETKYKFSYLFFILGILGMVGIYGLQFLPAVYLKIRGVSWGRFFRVAGLVVLYALLLGALRPVTDVDPQQGVKISAIVLNSILFLATIFVWILIGKKANRWIAEGKEPLKSILKRTQRDSN